MCILTYNKIVPQINGVCMKFKFIKLIDQKVSIFWGEWRFQRRLSNKNFKDYSIKEMLTTKIQRFLFH